MIQPENVTGYLISWEATNELRWYVSGRRKSHNQQLQQKWVNRQTKEEEWRDIQVVTATGSN